MSLAFSPDGKTLACGNAKAGFLLWDVKTGKLAASLRGHARDVSAVAYSPDGKILASASADGTIDLWDVAAEKHNTTMYANDGSLSHDRLQSRREKIGQCRRRQNDQGVGDSRRQENRDVDGPSEKSQFHHLQSRRPDTDFRRRGQHGPHLESDGGSQV